MPAPTPLVGRTTKTFDGKERVQAKHVCCKRGENKNTPLSTDEQEHAATMVLRIMDGRETESPTMLKERRSTSRHLQDTEEEELCRDAL